MKAAVFASFYTRLILALSSVLFSSSAFGIAPDVPSCHPERRVLASVSEKVIPDGGSLSSQLTAANFPSKIWDLDVITKVSHLSPGQLVIKLISPSGAEVTLSSNNGEGVANALGEIYWDDQANSPVSLHEFVSGQAAQLTPEEPLDLLQGEIPNGEWKLLVEDQANGVEGSLEYWELRFTLCSPSIIQGQTDDNDFPSELPEGEATSIPLDLLPIEGGNLCGISVTANVLHSKSDQLRLELLSPEGQAVTLTEANGAGFENAFFTAVFNNREDNPVTDSDFSPNPVEIPSPIHNLLDSPRQRFYYSPQESLALHYGYHIGGNWSLRISDLSLDGQAPTFGGVDVRAYECQRRTELLPKTYQVAENAAIGTDIGSVTGTKPFSVAAIPFTEGITFDSNFSQEMRISLSETSIIQSVVAFPSSSGEIHFNYRSTDSQGPSGKKISQVFVGNTPTRLGLELTLPPGEYIIDAAGSTVDSLGYRAFENSLSKESLTVASPDDRSFFFLDWQSRIFINSFGDKPYAGFCGPLRITQDGRLTVVQDSNSIGGGLDYEKQSVLFCDLPQSPSDSPLRIEILDVDENPPSITCPPDVTLDSFQLAEEFSGSPTVSDDSGESVQLSYFDTSSAATCPNAALITRKWTATDSQSNEATCQQVITLRDKDSDEDGILDCFDGCPADEGKMTAGICGCGVEDSDSDGDLIADCEDTCPADSNKSEPGVCGCGTPDGDENGDGEIACIDSHETESSCAADERDCYYSPLPQSACVSANGFLGQTNIVSVLNLQADPLSIELQYLDQVGVKKGSISTSIAAGVKRDFIINELGLLPDTVGTVCVYTDAKTNGSWSGGITLYKQNTRVSTTRFGDSFDFAIFHPFRAPRIGPAVLPLNTFHLGTSPDALVANWLSITDATPGDGDGLSGILTIYDAEGEIKSSTSLELVDGGRIDVPAHDLLTAAKNFDAIGLARFEPKNRSGTGTPYYISLSRYFYDCPSGVCENFLTAFSLPLRDASPSSLYGGVSTVGGELSVVEVLNPKETSVAASLTTRNRESFAVLSTSRPLAPRGTLHIISSEVLGVNNLGTMAVDGKGQPISALSLFYKLNSFNVLEYAYAAPLVGFAGTSQISQFNSFIEQQNDVEAYNAAEEEISFDVHVVDYQKTTLCSDTGVKLAAGETTRFTLPLPSDSYGTVVVKSNKDGLILRTYVQRADSYVLTFPGSPVSEELVAKVIDAGSSCF